MGVRFETGVTEVVDAWSNDELLLYWCNHRVRGWTLMLLAGEGMRKRWG